DAFARSSGARTLSLLDNTSQVYKKLVISEDGKRLLGGILVGDASAYGQLLTLCQNAIALPPHPEELVVPPREGAKPAGLGVDALPAAATICSCHNVSKGAICQAN